MTPGSTTNSLNNAKLNLKLGLFNAENLFLIFDHEIPPHYHKLTESQWQKLSAAVYENKPLQKCMQIGQLILNNSPDIMMFCEIGGLESLTNFNKLFLNESYHVALIEGNSDRNIDVGFLIKKEASYLFEVGTNKEKPLNFLYPHEVTSKKTGYYVKGSTHFFSRDCAELRLFTKTKDSPFLILLLTHLKSRLDPERIDPGGTERRSAELRTAIDIYKELQSQHPATPIVFAGDMNGYAGRQETDTEFLPVYSETDLEDVLELANVSIDKRSTFYQVKSGGRTEGKQIDYCFVSKNLSEKLVKSSAHVYRYKDEFGFDLDIPKNIDEKLRLPSDHYPLFFNLENLEF